jgi:hypothetical protein
MMKNNILGNILGGLCFWVLCINIMEGIGMKIAVPALITWLVLAFRCFWNAYNDKYSDD